MITSDEIKIKWESNPSDPPSKTCIGYIYFRLDEPIRSLHPCLYSDSLEKETRKRMMHGIYGSLAAKIWWALNIIRRSEHFDLEENSNHYKYLKEFAEKYHFINQEPPTIFTHWRPEFRLPGNQLSKWTAVSVNNSPEFFTTKEAAINTCKDHAEIWTHTMMPEYRITKRTTFEEYIPIDVGKIE